MKKKNQGLTISMQNNLAVLFKISKILVFIFLLLMVACNGNNSIKPPQQFSTSTESQWNGGIIGGTVKNLNDATISFVSVEFDLVDEKHRTITTVSASNDKGIEPNGKWDFEIQAVAVGARSTVLKQTITR